MSFLRRFFSGVSTYPTITMDAAKIKAQTLIKENPVVVFSKSYCPYCKATKKKLDGLGVKYTALELNEESTSMSPICPFILQPPSIPP